MMDTSPVHTVHFGVNISILSTELSLTERIAAIIDKYDQLHLKLFGACPVKVEIILECLTSSTLRKVEIFSLGKGCQQLLAARRCRRGNEKRQKASSPGTRRTGKWTGSVTTHVTCSRKRGFSSLFLLSLWNEIYFLFFIPACD